MDSGNPNVQASFGIYYKDKMKGRGRTRIYVCPKRTSCWFDDLRCRPSTERRFPDTSIGLTSSAIATHQTFSQNAYASARCGLLGFPAKANPGRKRPILLGSATLTSITMAASTTSMNKNDIRQQWMSSSVVPHCYFLRCRTKSKYR
jgi:hypothetical protein